MGVCFSCRLSTPAFKNVRVVHLNDHVEDFDHPVTVHQVTERTGEHLLCSPAQLLSIGVKPLQPTTLLEAGHIYLLLPHSTFLTHDVSPLDLASTVKKLTRTAQTSPSRGPCRFQGHNSDALQDTSHVKTRSKSWKPVLDPMRERSFRINESQSDVQEKDF